MTAERTTRIREAAERTLRSHDHRLRAAFERDKWAGEWNSLPTALDALLSDVLAAHPDSTSEQWQPHHGTVEEDLRSRLACIAGATGWDRPYDTRLDAIRGLCDLTTNGMTLAPGSPPWLCSQCSERSPVMVKIGTSDGWCTQCLDEAAGSEDEPPPAAIDAAHLSHQREWSRETFGPGPRLGGVLDHIRRELREVEAQPFDVFEWADVLILAFDGAWRCGHEPQDVIDAIKAKQAINEARMWPDWRDYSEDQAIEHIEPAHDLAGCPLPDVRCLETAPHAPHDWASIRHRWCCPGVPESTV